MGASGGQGDRKLQHTQKVIWHFDNLSVRGNKNFTLSSCIFVPHMISRVTSNSGTCTSVWRCHMPQLTSRWLWAAVDDAIILMRCNICFHPLCVCVCVFSTHKFSSNNVLGICEMWLFCKCFYTFFYFRLFCLFDWLICSVTVYLTIFCLLSWLVG